MPDGRDAVVIPASRYPHGYASLRSLAQAGLTTIAAVADESLPITASRFCDEVVVIPPSHELQAYKDALLELAVRPDVRTIIPHRPPDPYLLSKHADEFDAHIDSVVPQFETLQAVHDRKQLMDAAAAAGVPVPETQLLDTDEADVWNTDRIIKSRYNLLTDEYVDAFGHGDSQIAKSVIHVSARTSPDRAAICEKMHHVPIVQEYIDGADEYVFGALYDHGEALATFQNRQLREDSYTGGGGVFRESVDIPALDLVGRTLLDHLEWNGLACIEYIEDAVTGEFKPIEINPRMWQSLACATRAGAAFPYWYWLCATGRADGIDADYKTGVGTHYIYGELEHLVSIARSNSSLVDRPSLPARIGEILRSCYEVPAFDYLHRDDPFPVLQQARTEVGQMIMRRFG